MPDPASLASSLMPAVRQATLEAGRLAGRFFRKGAKTSARIWSKTGGSPVTEADMAVDAFLKERLGALLPEAAWLSEETEDHPRRLDQRLVWIVDPIDGTRAFLNGHADWSVAVGLAHDGRPILGVVEAPARGRVYEASLGKGARADGAAIMVSQASNLAGARVAGPKPLIDHLERGGRKLERLERIPSLALRLARVAEGSVDLGLVSSDARDWDLAAAEIILSEAGGRLTTLEGTELVYNRPEPRHGELAAASRRLHPAVIEAMRSLR